MGAVEETGKAVGGAIDAMKSTPGVIALLAMNVIILVFAAYIAKTQLGMIGQLVSDIRDCRGGDHPKEAK